jgi:hypothetical protein
MRVYLRDLLLMNGSGSAASREDLNFHAYHLTLTCIRHRSTSLDGFVVFRRLTDRSRVRGRLIHRSEVRRASFLSGRRDSPAVLLSLSLFVGRDILVRSFGFFYLALEGVPGPPIVEGWRIVRRLSAFFDSRCAETRDPRISRRTHLRRNRAKMTSRINPANPHAT